MTQETSKYTETYRFSYQGNGLTSSSNRLSLNDLQLPHTYAKTRYFTPITMLLSNNCILISREPIKKTKQNSSRDLDFIERFQSIIQKHFHSQPLNRAFVATSLHIGERHLSRKLSNLKQLSFTTYLRQYRLARAIELLGLGLQVAEIAERVGYSDTAYFCSLFKREFGKTVKQYEREIPQSESENFPKFVSNN